MVQGWGVGIRVQGLVVLHTQKEVRWQQWQVLVLESITQHNYQRFGSGAQP